MYAYGKEKGLKTGCKHI